MRDEIKERRKNPARERKNTKARVLPWRRENNNKKALKFNLDEDAMYMKCSRAIKKLKTLDGNFHVISEQGTSTHDTRRDVDFMAAWNERRAKWSWKTSTLSREDWVRLTQKFHNQNSFDLHCSWRKLKRESAPKDFPLSSPSAVDTCECDAATSSSEFNCSASKQTQQMSWGVKRWQLIIDEVSLKTDELEGGYESIH